MTNGFSQRVTTIKGLSDRRRLPRLGRIRLGLKAITSTGKEYPREVPYFVCPPEVQKIYGDKPTELDVMLPLNDLGQVFPCAYKHYGSGKGLKCSGDGEIAHRVNDETKEMEQVKCPCKLLEDKKCKQVGTLMAILPKVSVGGIYQITTSSINSIIDINSGLDYIGALLGRFAMVPCKLRRVVTETHHDDKKQNHYTLQVIFDGDVSTINSLRADTMRILEHPRFQLPAPLDENPALDPVDIVQDEEAGEPEPPPVTYKMKLPTDKMELPTAGTDNTDKPGPTAQGGIGLSLRFEQEPPKTKKTKVAGRDLGMAIKCPDKEGKIRPKDDCNACEKREGCPAWS